MTFKIVAISIGFLALTGAAQAQMQPNSTPTGAAVPSAQQVTGRAADANGRDQSPGNENANRNASHADGDRAAPPPNPTTTK